MLTVSIPKGKKIYLHYSSLCSYKTTKKNLLYAFFWVIPRRLNFMYMPTFWNTLSVPSSRLPAYEDGTDEVFQNVSISKFIRRGITQKKAYSIQNTVKV
jgi:hypothetical protein